jgi:relaxase-like protein
MIFKIMPPVQSFHGIDYNENKQKQGSATKVYFENFGHLHLQDIITKKQFKEYLENYSASNKRIIKPQFHAVLSCQGNTHSYEELKKMSIQIMHGLGYKETPILIYEHHDTSNNHVHIVTSRVDIDGKKIPDYNEGKRAQVILNNLLELNSKQQYENDLQKSLQYNINSVAQFLLLMERAGYKKSEQANEFIFHKYGERQGSVNKDLVSQKIEQDKTVERNTAKIKALIYKYRSQYTSKVEVKEPFIHTSAPKVFESELTNYLHKNFGLEFIFFCSKGHDQPYGYTVLDHKNNIAYKGSEIMNLEQLQQPVKVENNTHTLDRSIENSAMKQANEVVPEPSDTITESATNSETLDILDAIIDTGLKDNEAYSQKLSGSKTPKRKSGRSR